MITSRIETCSNRYMLLRKLVLHVILNCTELYKINNIVCISYKQNIKSTYLFCRKVSECYKKGEVNQSGSTVTKWTLEEKLMKRPRDTFPIKTVTIFRYKRNISFLKYWKCNWSYSDINGTNMLGFEEITWKMNWNSSPSQFLVNMQK